MSIATVPAELILVNGSWVVADASGHFQSANPATGELLPELYPISSWSDCEKLLDAATAAAEELRNLGPQKIADFLDAFAEEIDSNIDELAAIANLETALPVEPRLAKVEGPRTSGQLRQAAALD